MSVINMLPQPSGVSNSTNIYNAARASTGTAMYETDTGTMTITEVGTCLAWGYAAGGNNAVVRIYHNGETIADTGWAQASAAQKVFKVKVGDTVRVYVASYKGSWQTTQHGVLITLLK